MAADGFAAYISALADAIAAEVEAGGPGAARVFLAGLAKTCGRPDGYLYGYDAGDDDDGDPGMGAPVAGELGDQRRARGSKGSGGTVPGDDPADC